MAFIDHERLHPLGLTPALARAALEAAAPFPSDAAPPRLMRVTEIHRETLRLSDGGDELGARVAPRLMRELLDADTALAVGDWVLAQHEPPDALWVQARVAPQTHLVRRDADGRRHPVVSNVDTVLLVMGLDDDFNPRRLERYLTLVLGSGLLPVVVLTKLDVAGLAGPELESRLRLLRGRIGPQVDVLAVDGTSPAAARALSPYLRAGQTLAVMGSSGAGKSTLTNTLMGRLVQDTGAVREHDSRGKHTTTSRSLHRLPGGACVIDTPGLRALRPDADESTVSSVFADIEALAAQCRFRDCAHHDEPGCAVRRTVDADRLRNYHKLLREARRDTMSVLERQRQVAVWKARGRAGRERLKEKRGAG